MIVLSKTDVFILANAVALKAMDAEKDSTVTDGDIVAYDRLMNALQKMFEDLGDGIVLLQAIPAPLNGL